MQTPEINAMLMALKFVVLNFSAFTVFIMFLLFQETNEFQFNETVLISHNVVQLLLLFEVFLFLVKFINKT